MCVFFVVVFLFFFFCFLFFFFFFFFFFSKIGNSYLDLKPSNLRVQVARDIIIPNIYVKLYESP